MSPSDAPVGSLSWFRSPSSAAPVVLVAVLVIFLAVAAGFVLVSTGSGGNHTTRVAVSFATNDAPRADQFAPSVTPFNRLFLCIIYSALPRPPGRRGGRGTASRLVLDLLR